MKQKIEICENGATRIGGTIEIDIDHLYLSGFKVAILGTDTAADVVRKLNDEIVKQPGLDKLLEAVEVRNEM